MTPHFSVVLPTHNRPELLPEAIASVIRQRWCDWELIVVDDASDVPLRASDLEQQAGRPVKLLRHEHSQGGAAAKNTGVEAATGVFLAFLDDDDTWDPGYLNEAAKAFERHPHITTLFMGVDWFGESAQWGLDNHDRGMRIILEWTETRTLAPHLSELRSGLFTALLRRVPMPFQRPVLRREDFFRIGAYREHCLLWDCDFALRATLSGPCAFLDQRLYQQRASHQGYSSKVQQTEEQIKSALEIKSYLQTYPASSGKLYQQQLQQSLYQGWFDYAWWLCEQRRHQDAWKAFRQSLRYDMTWSSTKLLARILIGRMLPL